MSTTPATPILPNLVVQRKGFQQLNTAGLQLANLAAWHLVRIGNTGMLSAPPEPATTQAIGSVPNPAAVRRSVWVEEPPGAVPFLEKAAIAVPAATATDFDILSFVVPQGFDGVIKWLANVFNGPNSILPVPSPLIWKIMIDHRPARNFGNITQQNGTAAFGVQISPIRIFSGQLIEFTVQQVIGGTVTGTTVASLSGYYYPSKGIS